MSTNYSPEIKFSDDVGERIGRIVWHNTSSTASWVVDGETRLVLSVEEAEALQIALSSDSGGSKFNPGPEEMAEVKRGLFAVGGWKRRP